MSASGEASQGHDHVAHEPYLGTPADRPGPGEPDSPGWLPLLGLGLLVCAVIGYAVTEPAGKTADELANSAASAAPAPTPAAPPAPPSPAARPPRLAPSALPGAFQRLQGRPGREPGAFAVPGDGREPRPPVRPRPAPGRAPAPGAP